MSDELVEPINGVLKAFHKGILLSQRVRKAARGLQSAQVLNTLESAESLEKTFVNSEVQVKNAYRHGVVTFGRQYAATILGDDAITNKLQSLIINLQEQLMSLGDYLDDPSVFDLTSFPYIQQMSEKSRDETIHILSSVHQDLLSAGMQFRHHGRDDRTQLSSQRQSSNAKPLSEISPMQPTPPHSFPSPAAIAARPPPLVSPVLDAPFSSFSPRIATDDQRTARKISPSHYEINVPTGTFYGSSEGFGTPRHMAAAESDKHDGEPMLRMIDREEVVRQMTLNEELLERRRRTRMSFYQDMQNKRESAAPLLPSPTLSPVGIEKSPSGPILTGNRRTSQSAVIISSRGGKALLSPEISGPRYSPTLLGRPESIAELPDPAIERPSSIASEPMIFGPPESPPLSPGRQSVTEDWSFLARTLKVPGFGEGVEEGKEVAGQLVSDPGLMLANEGHEQPTPALSIQSVDYPIRHDSSYFLYGGFCEAARQLVRGEAGALKVVKKPGGGYTALISMRCVRCAYEMDFNVYERDCALDPAGIYSKGELRFRNKFLTKCHVATKHIDDPTYACVFCIEDGKTSDEYEATVFFSVDQFFRHLHKHSRPLKAVEGITVLYGSQPAALDFDIHFKTMEPSIRSFGDINAKIASRPKARAIANHRSQAKGFKDRDPEYIETLQFAVGARIVAVTFPPRFNGVWCCGYHNGEKANFPASTVALEPPATDDVVMNSKSTLCATAKWDHKPKDTSAGWLSFGKKDKITNIGFPYQEAWCWTGQNSKGKWGFFPACFVEGLSENVGISPRISAMGKQDTWVGSPKGHGSGSFALSRLPTRAFNRRSTTESHSSGGSINITNLDMHEERNMRNIIQMRKTCTINPPLAAKRTSTFSPRMPLPDWKGWVDKDRLTIRASNATYNTVITAYELSICGCPSAM